MIKATDLTGLPTIIKHWKHRLKQCHLHLQVKNTLVYTSVTVGWWPAGGGVVSVVRFSLGGAYRCRCGWAGPFHQPQGLEGVVIQALLREKALRRVQQQQVLTHENREGAPECTRQPEQQAANRPKRSWFSWLLPLSNTPQHRYS